MWITVKIYGGQSGKEVRWNILISTATFYDEAERMPKTDKSCECAVRRDTIYQLHMPIRNCGIPPDARDFCLGRSSLTATESIVMNTKNNDYSQIHCRGECARHSRSLGLAHSNRAPRLRGGYAFATRRANHVPCRALNAHVRVTSRGTFAALAPLRVRTAHRSTRIVKTLLHPKNNAKHSYFSVFCSHVAPKTAAVPLSAGGGIDRGEKNRYNNKQQSAKAEKGKAKL